MRFQCAARGRCVEGPCRRRGSEAADGGVLRVRLQPLLRVCWANLMVGLAPPPQVVEGVEPVVHRGWDASWSCTSTGSSAASGHTPVFAALAWSLRRVWNGGGVVVSLLWHFDDHAGAVGYANHGPGSRQALWVADGDVCVRWAECANDPFRALLPTMRNRKGSCRAGVRDGSCVEVRDVRGPDGVAVQCCPQVCLLVGALDQCGGAGPPGSCRLLGAQMVCSRTARGQGSATM